MTGMYSQLEMPHETEPTGVSQGTCRPVDVMVVVVVPSEAHPRTTEKVAWDVGVTDPGGVAAVRMGSCDVSLNAAAERLN